MTEEKLEFEIRTGKITIDYSRCEPAIKNSLEPSCGFACVKACRLYGRNVLRIEGNIPVLTVTDAAGNSSDALSVNTFTIDPTAPY